MLYKSFIDTKTIPAFNATLHSTCKLPFLEHWRTYKNVGKYGIMETKTTGLSEVRVGCV